MANILVMLSPGEREELKRSIAEELRDYIETEEFKLFKEAGYIAQSKLQSSKRREARRAKHKSIFIMHNKLDN